MSPSPSVVIGLTVAIVLIGGYLIGLAIVLIVRAHRETMRLRRATLAAAMEKHPASGRLHVTHAVDVDTFAADVQDAMNKVVRPTPDALHGGLTTGTKFQPDKEITWPAAETIVATALVIDINRQSETDDGPWSGEGYKEGHLYIDGIVDMRALARSAMTALGIPTSTTAAES